MMSALYLQISYQSIESSDPAVNVPGPRRTVSKLRNETYHVFSNLHPGTTYLFSVRARTGKGFGQTALTEITTNISGGFPGLHPGAGAFLPPRQRWRLPHAPLDFGGWVLLWKEALGGGSCAVTPGQTPNHQLGCLGVSGQGFWTARCTGAV